MAQIILDFGSGNTCRNDWDYAKRMIDEMHAVNTGKHEVIIKWQLFEKAGENIPLKKNIFHYALHYALGLGYKTTASVFDKSSLNFLLEYDVPFIKIANNRILDHLIGDIPRNVPVYVSVAHDRQETAKHVDVRLACVSNYPADIADYENKFYTIDLKRGISDHTTNWQIFNKYKPNIYECHYKLEDSIGLDSGEFARTPEQLSEIL